MSITLLSLPPIHIWEEDFIPRLAEVNDGYRGLAAEKELRFVDAAAWELPMAFDGIHLSEEGHRVLAEKLAPKIKVTEVVAALIWDGDRFMICQRPAHKARGLLWEFVGGKVEPGETKAEALIRECREELGVTVTVGRVFMELLHEYPDITIRLTLLHAAIAEGIPQKLEHNDIRWITKEEIPLYDFCPADKEILAAIQERL